MLQQQLMEMLAYDRQRRLEQALVQRALLKTLRHPSTREHPTLQKLLHYAGVCLVQWGLTLQKKADPQPLASTR